MYSVIFTSIQFRVCVFAILSGVMLGVVTLYKFKVESDMGVAMFGVCYFGSGILSDYRTGRFKRMVSWELYGIGRILRHHLLRHLNSVVGLHFHGYTPNVTNNDIIELATRLCLEYPPLCKNMAIAAAYLTLVNRVGKKSMDKETDLTLHAYYKLIKGLSELWKPHPEFDVNIQ